MREGDKNIGKTSHCTVPSVQYTLYGKTQAISEGLVLDWVVLAVFQQGEGKWGRVFLIDLNFRRGVCGLGAWDAGDDAAAKKKTGVRYVKGGKREKRKKIRREFFKVSRRRKKQLRYRSIVKKRFRCTLLYDSRA